MHLTSPHLALPATR